MQGYHCSFEAAMSLTYPQIVMLNHGAWYNRKRGEEQYERDKKKKEREEKKRKAEQQKNPYIDNYGKTLDEMNSEEQAAYFRRAMVSVRMR